MRLRALFAGVVLLANYSIAHAELNPELRFVGRGGLACTYFSKILKRPQRAPVEVEMYETCDLDQGRKDILFSEPPHLSRTYKFLVDCSKRDAALAETRYFTKQFWQQEMSWARSTRSDPSFNPYSKEYEKEFDMICESGLNGSGNFVPLGYQPKKKPQPEAR